METTFSHDPEGRVTAQKIAFGKAVESAVRALAISHFGHEVAFAAVVDLEPGNREEVETMLVTNLPKMDLAYGLMCAHIMEEDDPGKAEVRIEEVGDARPQ